MMTDLREFHDELRAIARDLLSKASPDIDPKQLTDAGWLGLEVPESLGGAGASFVETAIVLEELGRAAARTGYLGTALSVAALSVLDSDSARDALLEGIGAGAPTAFASGFSISSGTLSGRAEFVPDAAEADVVVLLADLDGTLVLATSEDLTISATAVLDETRALATVAADSSTIAQTWPLPIDPAVLQDRAAVAVACDSLGVAEAMLAETVDYVKVRHQFGRAIGSFQAVKHACADMLVRTSVARELVSAAVRAIADGTDTAAPAAMAKSYACDAAVDVAGKAMQLHGGIGYTWESGIHTYLKRATLNRALFDSPAIHRQRLATRYE